MNITINNFQNAMANLPLKVLRQVFQTLENRSDLNSNVWNFKPLRKVARSGTWGSCRHLRVELEEVGDAVGVGAGRLETISLVHERVEVRVRLHQVRRHRERIVEVGQRRAWMRGTRVKNHLRCRANGVERLKS